MGPAAAFSAPRAQAASFSLDEAAGQTAAWLLSFGLELHQRRAVLWCGPRLRVALVVLVIETGKCLFSPCYLVRGTLVNGPCSPWIAPGLPLPLQPPGSQLELGGQSSGGRAEAGVFPHSPTSGSGGHPLPGSSLSPVFLWGT